MESRADARRRRRNASARHRGNAPPQPGSAEEFPARIEFHHRQPDRAAAHRRRRVAGERHLHRRRLRAGRGAALRQVRRPHAAPASITICPGRSRPPTRPRSRASSQINIGYRTAADTEDNNATGEDIPDESYMLTGDENIVDINFTVFWRDQGRQRLSLQRRRSRRLPSRPWPKAPCAKSSARSQLDIILTSDREAIQIEVKELMQKTLDSYNAGIRVTDVNDAEGRSAERSARRLSRRAGGAGRPGPQAQRGRSLCQQDHPRGARQAAQIVQDAEAYRQQVIAEASGQAKRFLSVYQEYRRRRKSRAGACIWRRWPGAGADEQGDRRRCRQGRGALFPAAGAQCLRAAAAPSRGAI